MSQDKYERQNRKLWPKLSVVPQRTDLQISCAPLVKSDKSVAYKCLNISKEEQKEHDNIFELPFLARLSSTGSPPWCRMVSAGNKECDAIRVKQPSCPSHIFLQGCGKGRKRRQRDTPQCNVIRVKKPYPAKDDAIFSVLQIHHRWKRRKKNFLFAVFVKVLFLQFSLLRPIVPCVP